MDIVASSKMLCTRSLNGAIPALGPILLGMVYASRCRPHERILFPLPKRARSTEFVIIFMRNGTLIWFGYLPQA